MNKQSFRQLLFYFETNHRTSPKEKNHTTSLEIINYKGTSLDSIKPWFYLYFL